MSFSFSPVIKQACNRCSRKFSIPAKYLGRRIKCPVCSEPILVASATQGEKAIIGAANKAVQHHVPKPKEKPPAESKVGSVVKPYVPWFDPVVAVAMVLLAASYVGLIVAILVGVAYHTFNNYKQIIVLGDEASFLVFVVYIIVIVVGLGIAFFLLKPVLAKRKKPIARQVTRKSEPVLFMLLGDISDFFGIEPVAVCELENHFDVNARFIQSGDKHSGNVALSLGFPMLVNLNQQQAAALIAQELVAKKIETQSITARLIRWIHSWFFNAAQTRDSWDQFLSRIRFRRGILSTPIVMLVQFCVFLNRRVLWGFFVVSQAVSNLSFRSYYARASELVLRYCGEEAFLDFNKELPISRLAFQASLRNFVQSYHTTQAVDDLAGLVEAERKSMDKPSVLSTQMNLAKKWTRPWESRPNQLSCEKIARRAESEKSHSFFGTGKKLFSNFKSTSRQLTTDLHEFLMMGDFVQLKEYDRRLINIGFTKLPTGLSGIGNGK